MRLKKRIAELLQIAFRDTDAAVGNSEQDFTALDASADEDAAAAAAKLDRVRKQIQYDLAHRPLIRSDFGESSGKLDREANAFLPGL